MEGLSRREVEGVASRISVRKQAVLSSSEALEVA